VLGSDPVAAWRLRGVAYGLAQVTTDDGGVEDAVRWVAEFTRTG
jgi:hypothetical protein